MKLVVGLGNIGKEYENTRHNVGFLVLDSFVSEFRLENKFRAMIKKEQISGIDVLFVKPVTYMNLSGEAVKKIVDYYHIDVADIIIIHDDLDLSFGRFRLKENSSSGGHNGIKSIIQCLGTQQFNRLKIGIANNKNMDTKDYVLSKFSKDEALSLKDSYPLFQEIIGSFLRNGMTYTMNHYNKNKE